MRHAEYHITPHCLQFFEKIKREDLQESVSYAVTVYCYRGDADNHSPVQIQLKVPDMTVEGQSLVLDLRS